MNTAPINIINVLTNLIQNNHLHAKFLNTLSFIEFCGAQKLAHHSKFLGYSSFFLEHIAEEYRHAFFLRRLSKKMSLELADGYHESQVFCLKESRSYIQSIDRKICIAIRAYPDHNKKIILPYLLVTFAIEHRALSFYGLYQQVLDKHKVPISVRSIISEEENHLLEIKNNIKKLSIRSEILDMAMDIEENCFKRWLTVLSAVITY